MINFWVTFILVIYASTAANAGSFNKPNLETKQTKFFNSSFLPKKLTQPGPGSRPCCAFGTDIHFRYFPLIKIDQIMGANELTTHSYGGKAKPHKEVQGEIFSCKGGFLDSSHMRHAADWTAYVAFLMESLSNKGGKIKLLYEGGTRTLTIHPWRKQLNKDQIIQIAQRIAYDTTVWHEIITWFVPAVVPIFSEKSSSFAPEDNFSNLLGTYVAAEALRQNKPYNQAVVDSFQKYFKILDAKDRATTKKAFQLIADQWYQKKSRIPDPWKTLKRHLNAYPIVTPWRHPNQEQLNCSTTEFSMASLSVPEFISFEDGQQLKITDLYELEAIPHKKIPTHSLLSAELGNQNGKRNDLYPTLKINHRMYPYLVLKVGELIHLEYQEQGLPAPDLE